ncbi:MAG: hypothetical protein AABY53_02660 [Bdellovibrionota bacterium]
MKKVGLLKMTLVLALLLFSNLSFATNEVKTKEASKLVKDADGFVKFNVDLMAGLILKRWDGVGKDELWYKDLKTAQGSVLNLKFYPDKEFKAKPTAELKDEGFVLHDKLICKWIKIFDGKNKIRVLHFTEKLNEPCINPGLMQSFIDENSSEGGLIIEVDNTTPEYYEIIYKKEKFYINPKDIKLATYDQGKDKWLNISKAWHFKESPAKENRKLLVERMKRFENLLVTDPTLVKFLKDKSKCIKKKNFKCLFGKRGEKAIEEWLAYIDVATGGSDPSGDRKSYPLPEFGGIYADIFWKHVSNCHIDKPRYINHDFPDGFVVSGGSADLIEGFSVKCIIIRSKDRSWELKVRMEDYRSD